MLTTILRIITLLVLFGLAIWWGITIDIDYSTLANFSGIRWNWVNIAVLTVGLGSLARALRWKQLVQWHVKTYPFRDALGISSLAQTLNIVALLRSGDITKATLTVKHTPLSVVATGQILFIEKLCDALVLLALSIYFVPDLASQYTLNFITPVALLGAAFFLTVLIQHSSNSRAQIAGTLTFFRDRHSLFFSIIGLTFVFWISAWATHAALFAAQSLGLSNTAALLSLTLVFIGVVPNLTPANLAPAIGMSVFALSVYNVAPSLAIKHGLLVQLISLGVPLTISICYVSFSRIRFNSSSS